jgi:predicted dehydrogenase
MSEVWRALVVGCGRIGATLNGGLEDADILCHALAYRRHPRFVLAACVDPDAAAREACARRWGPLACHATLEAALAADRYDIVSVAGPTPTHLDALETLLGADLRAVFVEKPVGDDIGRARALVARYAARGCAFAVNFQRRFDPAMVELQAEIESGAWGRLRSVYGRYSRGIVNNGGHMLNLLAFLTGGCPRLVAVANPRHDGVPGDPTLDARFAYTDGTPVQLIGTVGTDYAIFELTLCFERGEVAIENFGFDVARRRVVPGAGLAGFSVLGARDVRPTGYGVAMLRALDQILAWAPGGHIASDGQSALATLQENFEARANAQHMQERAS